MAIYSKLFQVERFAKFYKQKMKKAESPNAAMADDFLSRHELRRKNSTTVAFDRPRFTLRSSNMACWKKDPRDPRNQ